MKRLTSDNVFEMSMTELALNQVFVEDGWAWYRKGPEDECSVCDLIRGAAAKGLDLEDIELDPNLTDEELGDVMLDWLQFGEKTPEGVLAILYRALWAMAEVRERLREARESLRNDPLTPEQLLELEGEPVWLGGDGLNRWDIFSGVSTDGIACFLRAALPMDSCGRTWFPFRRRPEASANAE